MIRVADGDGSVAFHDLPSRRFPFDVFAYPEESTQDDDLVWCRHVYGPGPVRIPSLEETGRRVRIVVRYADGTVDR